MEHVHSTSRDPFLRDCEDDVEQLDNNCETELKLVG